jgi:hypothetical protein
VKEESVGAASALKGEEIMRRRVVYGSFFGNPNAARWQLISDEMNG